MEKWIVFVVAILESIYSVANYIGTILWCPFDLLGVIQHIIPINPDTFCPTTCLES